MKQLHGTELALYIKERQAKQVRGLRQGLRVFPKLAIIQTIDSPVIDTYVRLKKKYGEDILVAVDSYTLTEDEALVKIHELNEDPTVHGIIVQLPLSDTSRTDQLLNAVMPAKDVDALGDQAVLDPATPMAINWLLAGHNIDLQNKHIALVGHGRLVGAPLARMWRHSGYDVTVLDEHSGDIAPVVQVSDVVVSAAGVPGLISSRMVRPGAVVVDAATASEGGKIIGDVAADVRARNDVVMTPEKGGVGPLTVAALFDNVIRAARSSAEPPTI